MQSLVVRIEKYTGHCEVIEKAPLNADTIRINFDPADQYYVAPSSTTNISVTSNSRDSFMRDAILW